MWRYAVSLMISAIILLIPASGLAQWPERGLTLAAPPPATLPWSREPDPRLIILEELLPRISRELGVPVTMMKFGNGQDILAANLVAGAQPDGYLFGVLPVDPATSWEIQGYTPYLRNEFAPVAVAWREVYAIVVPAAFEANDLIELAQSGLKPRLANTGMEPASASTLMALEAAKAAGVQWVLEKVDRLDPDLLLDGRADAMVLPLSLLRVFPRADQLKILTVLSGGQAPCSAGHPTLESQGLPFVDDSSAVIFYLPNKVNWRIRAKLSLAINNALRQPAVTRRLTEACLQPYIEDLEGSIDLADREYSLEKARLLALGLPIVEYK